MIEDLFSSPWRALITCLDILIVYYVIYRVLLTIKGTRAAQMVIAILLIGAASFVAERVDMSIVAWVLANFFDYFIIIIIVLFQQDIRRALMRIGQNVVPFGRTHQLSHALDEVLSAAQHLARARVGGIVVFEREARLKQFIDAGQDLDAIVSKELLVALFVPSRDNELHDGAVVINRELRIEQAGGVLPLSRSSELGQDYGTRHRAALGITEETDAVALVISEERGEISLCFKGNIARDLDVDVLRERMQLLFDEEANVRVAGEAEAAASIGRAVAALAAAESNSADERSSERAAERAPGRSGTRIPVTQTPAQGVASGATSATGSGSKSSAQAGGKSASVVTGAHAGSTTGKTATAGVVSSAHTGSTSSKMAAAGGAKSASSSSGAHAASKSSQALSKISSQSGKSGKSSGQALGKSPSPATGTAAVAKAKPASSSAPTPTPTPSLSASSSGLTARTSSSQALGKSSQALSRMATTGSHSTVSGKRARGAAVGSDDSERSGEIAASSSKSGRVTGAMSGSDSERSGDSASSSKSGRVTGAASGSDSERSGEIVP
ncbi:MAG: hypothetical protein Tsb0020_42330 [Haliangiales bacterium]